MREKKNLVHRVPYLPVHLHLKRIGSYVIPYYGDNKLAAIKAAIQEVKTILHDLESADTLFSMGADEDEISFWHLSEVLKNTPLNRYSAFSSVPIRCVYFYKHPCVQGIKIGSTLNLASRLRGLADSIRRKDDYYPVITEIPHQPYQSMLYLAFPNRDCVPTRLENMLHYHLRKHCITGEWYHSDAIIFWLKQRFPNNKDIIETLAEK